MTRTAAQGAPAPSAFLARRRRNLRWFVVPALVVVGAVIVFPWLFTLWMSAFDWKIGTAGALRRLRQLHEAGDQPALPRSRSCHTFYFTALAVVVPLVLGTVAALIFHREFPFRGVLRGVFIMPMMATPVAVALVWTMMFHPQQGVLNYLLSLVGLPPSLWVYSPTLVIPSLVLVEIWHWTPLVMLIVLGGLAALPTEPYESARLDGATRMAALPLHHAAAGRAVPARRRGDPHDRRAQDVRHDLRDHLGRPGHRVGDDQPLSVPAGVRVLQHRQRVGGRRRVLRRSCWRWRCCCCTCASGRNGHDGSRRRVAPASASPCASAPAPVAAQGRLLAVGGRHRVAGDPRVPVDAVAVAQERDRQPRRIRRCSSPIRRRSPTSCRCSSRTRSAATSWNSIVVSGGATLIALLVGVPAGYGIARTRRAHGSPC